MVVRVLLSMVLLMLPACSQDAAVSQNVGRGTAASAAPTVDPQVLRPSEGFDVAEIAFVDGDERIAMPVLVADERPLRATGLMHRTELPDDAGMLFVFDAPTTGSFWMKNTVLPLSIAFVGRDGTVQQVLDMEPCTADPCPRYAPDAPYVRAIEANQGYFRAHDITAGWSVEVGGGGL